MKIYLACPYSHPDPAVREARFEAVNRAAAQLMRLGHSVFSPISMTHPIAEAADLPKGWDFWAAQDLPFLEWCDKVVVLMLPGWKESTGVDEEVRIALDMGKIVEYIRTDDGIDVVMVPSDATSLGCIEEVQLAMEYGWPITYIDEAESV